MGSVKNFATVSTLAVAMAAVPCVGAAMDIGVGAQVRLNAGYLALNHDASGVIPDPAIGMTSFGDPTSVLSYEPLYRTDIEFVLTGRGGDGWFDLIGGFPIAGGGTFGDRDYEGGQALYSETFSAIELGHGGSVSLRYGLPIVVSEWNGFVVRPYFSAGLGLERYAMNGARCGDVCPKGAVAHDIVVIGQDLLSTSAGFGLWLEQELSENEAIDLRIEARGGYLGVSDSHYLRFAGAGALGPVPNIVYDFATLDVSGEAAYRHTLENGAELSVGLFAGGQIGLGQVEFGNGNGVYSAWSLAGEAGVTLGASVPF